MSEFRTLDVLRDYQAIVVTDVDKFQIARLLDALVDAAKGCLEAELPAGYAMVMTAIDDARRKYEISDEALDQLLLAGGLKPDSQFDWRD